MRGEDPPEPGTDMVPVIVVNATGLEDECTEVPSGGRGQQEKEGSQSCLLMGKEMNQCSLSCLGKGKPKCSQSCQKGRGEAQSRLSCLGGMMWEVFQI